MGDPILPEGRTICRNVYAPEIDPTIVLESISTPTVTDQFPVTLTGISGIDFTDNRI